MSLILSGTDGLSDIDGTAATPAIRGTDANTGIFFPAADTIAFSEGGTEAMRIDSSGNVGIGTTSPVNSGAGITTLTVNGTTQSGAIFQVAGVSTGFIYSNASDSGLGTLTATPYKFFTNSAERMRIDSSGNVGIGTSSPAVKMDVSGSVGGSGSGFNPGTTAWVSAAFKGTGAFGGGISFVDGSDGATIYVSGQNLVFGNGATSGGTTERMRIDSSGNLLVGTTSTIAAATLTIVGTTGFLGLVSGRQTTNTAGKYYNWGTSVDASPYWIVYNQDNVGVYIAPGGNTWTAGSDETIKENLKPIENPLNSVLSLRAVIGNYTADPEKVKHPFLIAQDVQKVLPEAWLQTKAKLYTRQMASRCIVLRSQDDGSDSN